MKRLVSLFVAAGILLAATAFYAYDNAKQASNAGSALCPLGGDCSSPIAWQLPAALAALAVAAFGAASVVAKRAE